MNVNLIVIFKCVSLKYLIINISARAASVALSPGGTRECGVRVCVCVSICPIPIYKIDAQSPGWATLSALEKGGFCSRLARIYHQKECVSRGREPVRSQKQLDMQSVAWKQIEPSIEKKTSKLTKSTIYSQKLLEGCKKYRALIW